MRVRILLFQMMILEVALFYICIYYDFKLDVKSSKLIEPHWSVKLSK